MDPERKKLLKRLAKEAAKKEWHEANPRLTREEYKAKAARDRRGEMNLKWATRGKRRGLPAQNQVDAHVQTYKTITAVKGALALAAHRLSNSLGFPIYQSVFRQSQYLNAILEGREKDKSRLPEIIMGYYAVREFEHDPEFADALLKAQWVANCWAADFEPWWDLPD